MINFKRDSMSGALISTDKNAYERAKNKKLLREKEKKEKTNKEIFYNNVLKRLKDLEERVIRLEEEKIKRLQ